MNTQDMEQVLLYLVDKLDPQSKEEVAEMLGGELPDVGQSAMDKGGKAWINLPGRLKTRAAMALRKPSQAADAKAAAPTFPHSGRLK